MRSNPPAAAFRLARLAGLAVLPVFSVFAVFAGMALGAVPAARAQLSPLDGQFQVNSYTTNNQYQPAVTADGEGNFLIVWTSFGSGGTDTSNMSIQARRWTASGAELGAEFQVNSFTTSTQRFPAVAAVSDGAFVAAWPSLGSTGTDTSDDSIQARRFLSNGVAIGG